MIKYFRRLYLKIEHPFILACAMLVSCQIILSMPIEQKSKPLTTLAMVVSTVAGVLFALSMRKTLKEFEWLQEIVWGVGFGTILLGTYVAIKNCPWWILGVELICGIAISLISRIRPRRTIRACRCMTARRSFLLSPPSPATTPPSRKQVG